MKKNIKYRQIEKKDINELAAVINESWDYEKMFSKKTAYHFSHVFLYFELARQSFTQIAEVDGAAAGVIIGHIKHKPKYNWRYYPKLLWHGAMLLTSREGRDVLMNYANEVDSLNKKMMKQVDDSFNTELSLFAVSPKTQGLGVGSTLYQYFMNKLKQEQIGKFFLYTDTTCNFRFYDHKGLKKIFSASKTINDPINKEIEFYIYGGNVE